MHSLKNLREYAQTHNIPIISIKTEHILKKLLSTYKPTSILEIGSAIGYSSFIMAQHIKEYTLEGIIYSFEVSFNAYIHLLSNLHHFKNYLPTIKPFNIDFLSYPSKHLPFFDFIFIDAKKSLYLDFFQKSSSHIKHDGIIVIDDIGSFPAKTHNLLEYLKQNNLNFETIPTEQNDSLLIIKF